MKPICKAALGVVLGIVLLISTESTVQARDDVTQPLIESAIEVLDFNRVEAQWTKSGKPRVDAIEALLGADISAADRDAAWSAYTAPTVEAAPAEDLAGQVDTLRGVIAAQSTEMAALNARINLLSNQRADWQERALGAEQSLQAAIANSDRRVAEALAEGLALEAEYSGLIGAAEDDRDRAARSLESANALAQQTLEEAHQTLEEAKARERGAGPSANQECREALHVVLDAGWTWVGNLDTNRDDVQAAQSACLGLR